MSFSLRAPACLAGFLLLAVSAGPAAAQAAPLDQLEPGPHPVAFWDWSFGTTSVKNPAGPGNITVQHYGRLYYPTDGSPGATPPVLPGASLPLVVFGHGRFQGGPTLGNNHLEAGYLMERMASWGLVATSVNLDVVGQFAFQAAIPQRGQLFRNTTRRTFGLAVNPIAGMPEGLAGALDATRVAFTGHSRGGEGAVAGAVQHLADPNGPNYEIVAVGTIAPTDFEQFTLPGVPYLGLYGSKDGDVNNGWPIVLHDRVDADEKHFEYIHGANHFWFTETIHFQGEGNADISRELHHEIAMGYLAGFLVRKLAVVPESTALLCDGPELAPLTAQVEILPMYRDPDRRVLDTFETVPDLFATSTGEPAFSVFPASLELPVGSQSPQLFHLGRGLFAVWLAGEEGAWGHVLPTGLDVTPWTHLSAKFLQGPLTGLNANGLDQDVRMWILDADYRLAFVPVSDFGSIPWPQFHAGGAFPSKRVYRTTRVPLAAFVDDVPDLDLTRVVATGWISDQTSAGELVFDDVEYTR